MDTRQGERLYAPDLTSLPDFSLDIPLIKSKIWDLYI